MKGTLLRTRNDGIDGSGQGSLSQPGNAETSPEDRSGGDKFCAVDGNGKASGCSSDSGYLT